MSNAAILLLDLNPETNIGSELQKILQANITPSVYVPQKTGFDSLLRESLDLFSSSRPDIVILSLSPDTLDQGMRFIQPLKGKPVIAAFNEFGSEGTIQFLKSGIADFILPPLKEAEIVLRITRLLDVGNGKDEFSIPAFKHRIGRQLIGQSQCFLAETNKIELVAGCDLSVLISGETGTGKELFARSIHYFGPRAGKPFVPISCGAIPFELVENEFFGHARGAFTGAHTAQAGLIQEADGGTLFLDEVDCLPPQTQVKLLRFLQEKEYKPLGAPKVQTADVRVIAATNQALEKSVAEGKFRQDLYYRLNVIPLMLPPLRDRKGDIPLLARHFLFKVSDHLNREVEGFTPDGLEKLMAYEWPGNVRELEHIIERAVVFAKEKLIGAADLSLPVRPAAKFWEESFRATKSRIVSEFEKRYIEDLLHFHQGSITEAAKTAKKNRRAFWELVRKYKIDVEKCKLSTLSP